MWYLYTTLQPTSRYYFYPKSESDRVGVFLKYLFESRKKKDWSPQEVHLRATRVRNDEGRQIGFYPLSLSVVFVRRWPLMHSHAWGVCCARVIHFDRFESFGPFLLYTAVLYTGRFYYIIIDEHSMHVGKFWWSGYCTYI
jgi:hypothetical protein